MRNEWCIVKVPPTASNNLLDKIVDMGYNQIHASNTLYTPKGGLSGQILVEHTLRIIDYIKNKHKHVEIIAGGGVKSKTDAQNYIEAGADHISLGTVCFTPWKVSRILK
jgi:dihydroorotate dehydrogenase